MGSYFEISGCCVKLVHTFENTDEPRGLKEFEGPKVILTAENGRFIRPFGNKSINFVTARMYNILKTTNCCLGIVTYYLLNCS